LRYWRGLAWDRHGPADRAAALADLHGLHGALGFLTRRISLAVPHNHRRLSGRLLFDDRAAFGCGVSPPGARPAPGVLDGANPLSRMGSDRRWCNRCGRFALVLYAFAVAIGLSVSSTAPTWRDAFVGDDTVRFPTNVGGAAEAACCRLRSKPRGNHDHT
jgi:hypothetical protein